MTRIEFFYDPSCPFCWITSRWLLQVAQHRELDVTWRPFSLALKNGELDATEGDSAHAQGHSLGHRVLRVIRAAEQAGASPIELYTAFGTRLHLQRQRDDSLIPAVIDELGLDRGLLDAADDASLDEGLAADLREALDAAGDEVGVPLIVFLGEDGTRRGYFGPVLNTLPEMEESLRLWDGLALVAPCTSFYELKRSRPAGGPDVASTAR